MRARGLRESRVRVFCHIYTFTWCSSTPVSDSDSVPAGAASNPFAYLALMRSSTAVAGADGGAGGGGGGGGAEGGGSKGGGLANAKCVSMLSTLQYPRKLAWEMCGPRHTYYVIADIANGSVYSGTTLNVVRIPAGKGRSTLSNYMRMCQARAFARLYTCTQVHTRVGPYVARTWRAAQPGAVLAS